MEDRNRDVTSRLRMRIYLLIETNGGKRLALGTDESDRERFVLLQVLFSKGNNSLTSQKHRLIER